MVGLVAWWVGQLVSWCIGWLVGLVGCVGGLVGWLVGWLVRDGGLVGWWAGWLGWVGGVGWLGWLVEPPTQIVSFMLASKSGHSYSYLMSLFYCYFMFSDVGHLFLSCLFMLHGASFYMLFLLCILLFFYPFCFGPPSFCPVALSWR